MRVGSVWDRSNRLFPTTRCVDTVAKQAMAANPLGRTAIEKNER